MFEGITQGISAAEGLNFMLVFLEGVLSFFSPCVIPVIPVYMSYLTGNAQIVSEDATVSYKRWKVFFHTLLFVLGISFAFFILGISFTAFGRFFSSNKMLFTRIGGIFIVIFGLYQLGIFNIPFLQRERRIHVNIGERRASPFMAFVLGFTFSFSWTPCIGPVLSSVLIMASGAKTSLLGNALVLVYTVGFVIPFLLIGLFTRQVLEFLKARQKLMKYAIKTGGIILVIIGIMVFTGWMNGISGYLNSIGNSNSKNEKIELEDRADDSGTPDTPGTAADADDNVAGEESNQVDEEEDYETIPAFDFTLADQYGNEHTLSEYKGKVVFLNFWATWCTYCQKELPYIEELYREYDYNRGEVVFLGVVNPKSKEYPYNQDKEKDEIISFLNDMGYTFPTLFDTTGEVLRDYYVSAFPMTFMIDKNGNIYGYVPGMMTKDIMINVIEQTLKATE